MERSQPTPSHQTQTTTWIKFLNQNKWWIQWAIALLGIAMTALSFYGAYQRVGLNFNTRMAERLLRQLAKPAELGIFPVVALYAARVGLKHMGQLKDLGRLLLRLLQIVHIPLATVILVASAVHGGLFALKLWKSDLHYWSGLVALAAMALVSLLGLGVIKFRKMKNMHLVTGITAFVLVLFHIVTA